MRTSLGGLRRDPLRHELSSVDKEQKRGIASGVRMVMPLCAYPAARIAQTTLQIIGAAWTTITMDATTFDNDGIASLGTDQLIVKFPGLYALFGSINWASVATPGSGDSRFARFLVNGVAVGEQGGWRVADGQQVRVDCQDVVSLARGGTIALQGFATAATVNTFVTNNAPSLTAVWVGVPS